jgi:hypothetical protein
MMKASEPLGTLSDHWPVFMQGYNGYQDGLALTDNPYDSEPSKWFYWNYGGRMRHRHKSKYAPSVLYSEDEGAYNYCNV